MKTIKRVVAMILFASVGVLNAQTPDAKLTVTKVVELSADKVWSKLRKMDDIDKYSSLISSVKWTGNKGVGGQRVCTSADGNGYFKESIVAFDDNDRSYSYALIEGVPAKGMVNNFKVVDLGYNKSIIVWTSTYEQFIKNPNMEENQFMGFLNQSVTEMIDKIIEAASKP